MEIKLEIRLLSPLNAGSGEGWAGAVDSDVVFDEYGLPYIPARRIRGVLKEAAIDVVHALKMSIGGFENMRENDVSALFGKQGEAEPSDLHIDNAFLSDYHALRRWLDWADAIAPHLGAKDRVISHFTHIRHQTEIEKGVAKKHSLRQTRVINTDHVFCAKVRLGPKALAKGHLLALAAMKSELMGGKRNRGLGRVRCRLLDEFGRNRLFQEAIALLRPKLV